MNEGKKDRRDPIRTVKPRNFVAKNASSTTSGAGAHKDKKKAEKNGDVKHKNQEYAESLQARLDVALLEDFDSPEYNDEAGMADSNLLTLARAVKGLLDTIEPGDNLPEWCQEKIAKSEMMLVSVWDYLLSQKEQGIDPKVSEAQSARDKWNKASAEREKKHNDAEAEIKKLPAEKRSGAAIDRLEKHVNATEATRTFAPPKTDLKVGDRVVADLRKEKNYPTDQKYVSGFVTRIGEKGVHIKPDGGGENEWHPYKIVKKLGESWTHDSLAAQLFETENTYEDRLSNLLNKRLGK